MPSSLTQARLKELLDYCPTTGQFTWKLRNSNRVKIGDIAGSLRQHGYVTIVIDGAHYYAHRLVFLYVYGFMPTKLVDHINGIRDNNRLANLRELDAATNVRRAPMSTANTSGIRNVSWSGVASKWLVQICVNGKRIHGGLFTGLEDARKCALALQEKYHA